MVLVYLYLSTFLLPTTSTKYCVQDIVFLHIFWQHMKSYQSPNHLNLKLYNLYLHFQYLPTLRNSTPTNIQHTLQSTTSLSLGVNGLSPTLSQVSPVQGHLLVSSSIFLPPSFPSKVPITRIIHSYFTLSHLSPGCR